MIKVDYEVDCKFCDGGYLKTSIGAALSDIVLDVCE